MNTDEYEEMKKNAERYEFWRDKYIKEMFPNMTPKEFDFRTDEMMELDNG